MSAQHDLAWAAGLFEGEGCFLMDRQRGYVYLLAKLAMTDEDVVKTFAEVVGVGSVAVVPPHTPNRKPLWRFLARGKEAEHVFTLLEPWLHSRRRARWAEIFAERKAYERRLPLMRSERTRKQQATLRLRRLQQKEQASNA